MTISSFENKEINDFPPEYSTVTGPAQEQSAILIENEQLKAEIAVLTAQILQQRGKRRRSSRENIELGVMLCVIVCIIPVSILIFIVISYYFF